MNCDDFYYLSNEKCQILKNYPQENSVEIKKIGKQ